MIVSRVLSLVLVCIHSALQASATSIQQAVPDFCDKILDHDGDGVAGRLSDLIAAGSCKLDDKLFSGFTYNMETSGLAASDIQVTGLDEPLNPSLIFAVNVTAGPGQSKSLSLGFRVTVEPGGANMHDAVLDIQGANIAGDGALESRERLCFEAFGGTGCTTLAARFPPGNFTDKTTFTPINGVDVSKSLFVQGGATSDSSVQVMVNSFSEVPEPRSSIVMACVLAVIVFMRRRKRRRCELLFAPRATRAG